MNPGGILLDHGGGWFSMYLHLSKRTVSPGAQVRMGDKIGEAGNTGTNDPHLHYELIYDANGDGAATTAEMVVASFNGVEYNMGANGERSYNVTSNNCGQPETRDVECFVFDDGFANMAGPSGAIFFKGPGVACIPDQGDGTCRKWFGRCRTKGDHVGVKFEAFNDGHAVPTPRSDAVYVRDVASACIPNGTPDGDCRKWFGEPRTDDGRTVTCQLFNDGSSNATAATGAIYYRASRQVCMPNNTAEGDCRKWFGNCVAR